MLQGLPPVVYEILAIFIIIIALVFCCSCCCRRRQKVVKEVHYVERPSETPGTRVVETQRVIEKVLVVCPFCGAKNEQGMTICKNCGAKI